MKYALFRSKVVKRYGYWEGKEPEIEWIREPGFPDFDTRVEAKRAWLVAMQETTPDAPDKHVNAIFRPFQYNLKQVKVMPVKDKSQGKPLALPGF